MDLKTTTVDGKLVDVITEETFRNKWEAYTTNPTLSAATAVEVEDEATSGRYILPFRGKNDDRPGIYPDGCIYFVKLPSQDIADDYDASKMNIVDFSDTKNIKDFLDKNSQIRNMETTVLTDVDSVFAPMVTPQDTPEMRAFKEAITAKHMDISKYAPRFGENFLNDKRILRTSSITMNKLVSMCKKLDIEAELILRDAGSNVANPMGKEINVILTGNGEGDEA